VDNGNFDPHSFGAGTISVGAMAAVAIAAGVHSVAGDIADMVAGQHYNEANDTIELVLRQNEEMREIVTRQNVIIDDLYASIAKLQLLLLANEQSSS
jgi:hypothetical protein